MSFTFSIVLFISFVTAPASTFSTLCHCFKVHLPLFYLYVFVVIFRVRSIVREIRFGNGCPLRMTGPGTTGVPGTTPVVLKVLFMRKMDGNSRIQ